MMGRAHSLSGAAVWLAAASFSPLTAGQVMAGTAVAAGAAVLPDLDEPGATVSRCLGPVSQAVAHGIRKISGGHRELTHSFVGAAAFGGVFYVLGWLHALTLLVVLGLVVAVGLEALGVNLPGAVYTEMVVRALIAFPLGLVAMTSLGHELVVLIVIGGCLVHDVGDWLTISGVPFFAPLSKRDYALKAFRTGGPVEVGLVMPLLVLCIGWFGFQNAPALGFPAPSLPSLPSIPVSDVWHDVRDAGGALMQSEGSTLAP